jgi:hypothetical protein
MDEILGLTFIVLCFGGGSVFLLAISPIGRAIADRIRRTGSAPEGEVRQLQERQEAVFEELEGVRREIADLHERLDFTERLVTRGREARELPGPQDVQK